MIDAYSKWLCVESVNTITSTKTINILRSWFAIYGLSVELVSDHGPQQCSAEFELFLSKNGIKQIRVPPVPPAVKWRSGEKRANCERFLEEISGK